MKLEKIHVHSVPALGVKYADFFSAVLSALEDEVVVIDAAGVIVYVNAAWVQCGVVDGMPAGLDWIGLRYSETCCAAKADPDAVRVQQGIERLAQSEAGACIAIEYSRSGPRVKRWFLMRATKMTTHQGEFVVIVHSNITRRKQAEQKAQRQAGEDSLTGLANRRIFDARLHHAWLQCRRERQFLSLISIDIDHFKLLNDTIGHPSADVCLKEIAHVIRHYARRPGDLAARIGGEEFVLLLPNTPIRAAQAIAEAMRAAISTAEVLGDTCTYVTASLGVVSVVPQNGMEMQSLLSSADVALYAAKHAGRNCVRTGVVELLQMA